MTSVAEDVENLETWPLLVRMYNWNGNFPWTMETV